MVGRSAKLVTASTLSLLVGQAFLWSGCTRTTDEDKDAKEAQEESTLTTPAPETVTQAPGSSTPTPQDPQQTSTGEAPGNTPSTEAGEAPTTIPDPSTSDSSTSPRTSTGSSSSSTSSNPTTSEGPPPECQAGDETSCLEREDGSSIDFPGGVSQGSCKAGKKVCEEGKWSPCRGAVEPKAKDSCELGNDDNCSGLPTDHCACSKGETQVCGSDVGACQEGTLYCQDDGNWGKECVGEVKPSKEICDGKADENCDGKSDEVNCECLNGQQRSCGVSDVGACRLGVQNCTDGKWGSCVGAIGPRPERCDGAGIDEDCDGAADLADSQCECIDRRVEACKIFGQRGDCGLGSRTCSAGRWGRCLSRFRASEEVCGIPRDKDDAALGPRTGDEDCDGQVDESDRNNNFMPKDPQRQGALYMLDEDGDGYGAMSSRQSDILRRYCNSRKNEVPADFVPAIPGRHNTDCGDCAGTGFNVNPGYTGPHMKDPNPCLQQVNWRPNAQGAFDYNCSNAGTLEHRGSFRCVLQGDSCIGVGHWQDDEEPRCGEEARFYSKDGCWKEEDIDKCNYPRAEIGFVRCI